MNEQWKDIKGYEGIYQVSNTGKIRSIKRDKLLKQQIIGNYRAVRLSKDNIQKVHYVHRLVAEHFIDNPKGYKYIKHKDDNMSNNRADNLQWIPKPNDRNKSRSVSKILDGTTLEVYDTVTQAAEENNLSTSSIIKVCRGLQKTAGGYEWRYL
jgi:hypothetical protein